MSKRQWDPEQEAFGERTRLDHALTVYENSLRDQVPAGPKRVTVLLFEEVIRLRLERDDLLQDVEVLTLLKNQINEELWRLKRHWFFRWKRKLKRVFLG